MRKILDIATLFLVCLNVVVAQDLKLGGLKSDDTFYITQSGISTLSPLISQEFGYKDLNDHEFDFEFAPLLKPNETWIAGFNIPSKKGKSDIFFYDSWVGTQNNIKTNARKRSFPNDVSGLIASNVYHIAFQREFLVENETFLLLISPTNQTVYVELPESVFKTKRTLTYEMKAWEAKFVHIVLPPKSASVVMWKEEPQREQLLLKDDWEFTFTKEYTVPTWENNPFLKNIDAQKVTIPHVFNYDSHFDFKNYKDTLDVVEMYTRGIGWYKTHFNAQRHWQQKYVKIDFLGVNQRADVWLNGKFVKTHIGGFTDFHHDITPLLLFDKPNELVVRVDNRFDPAYLPHTADFDSQGGIYREVLVSVINPVLIKSQWIQTPEVSATNAKVTVEVALTNKLKKPQLVTTITNIINPYNEIIASKIENHVLEPNSKVKKNVSLPRIDQPLLWSPESPSLYKSITTLKDENGKTIDQVSDNFGIRSFSFDKDKGFTLNDKPFKLYGVNLHQDGFMKGWAVDSLSRKKDYLLMKEMGVNFIRMSHYPHHPHALHLADSLGMMVWEEIPVVNSVGNEEFTKNAVKTTEEMILRDRNHPSIIMWGVGNEYYREYFTDQMIEWAINCTKATTAKAKELDPTRPTVQAQNDLVKDDIMSLTDLHGRNRYFGWYTGGTAYNGFKTYDGFEKTMEQERLKYPNWKVIISEYGAEGKYGFHVNNPQRFDHSETYQINFHKVYWNYIKKTDWIAGSTLWNMFDFTSFAKVGNIPNINQKGMMTYDRKPKSIFYYYQSQWTKKPVLYIVSHTWLHRFGDINETQKIEVFSNLDEVTLYVNGKTYETKKKSIDWIWEVHLKEGYNILKAVGLKEGIKKQTELTIHFEGKKTSKTKIKGNDSD